MIERTQALFEEIESYLNKSMDSEQRSSFEERMSSDPELQAEVERHEVLHDQLKETKVAEFVRLVEKISKEPIPQNTKPKTKTNFLRVAAAVLILLVGSIVIWYVAGLETTNESLYTSYYQPYPLEGGSRGENASKSLQNALAYYYKADYEPAIPALKEVVTDFPKEDQYKLYLASAYLNTNRSQEAILLLSAISNESKLLEDVKWYLALSYIKNDQVQEAKNALVLVISFNGARLETAKDLLGELK